MRRWWTLLWVSAFLFVGRPSGATTLLPLASEDAETLPAGRVEAILSAGYTRNQRFPNFTPAGALDHQDLMAAPQLGFRFGVGDWAEVQASFETLYLNERLDNGDHNEHFGAGDARLFTKVRFWRQQSWQPSLGVRFGAKLPNANFDDRLGTDETDFEITVLTSRAYSFGSFHTNLGIALLGNPGPAIAGDTSFQSGGQDDLFLWGIAYSSSPLLLGDADDAWAVRGLLEFTGNAGSRFDNERAVFRAGGQLERGPWAAFMGVSCGLNSATEDVGLAAGVSYRFSLTELFASPAS